MGVPDRPRQTRSVIVSVVLVFALIVICVVLISIGLDAACYSDINTWIPVYPNAEVVELDYQGLFRPRGMGVTSMLLLSPDPVNVVRHWYYKNLQTQIRLKTRRGLAQTYRWVEANPDGEGTQIFLYSSCAWN